MFFVPTLNIKLFARQLETKAYRIKNIQCIFFLLFSLSQKKKNFGGESNFENWYFIGVGVRHSPVSCHVRSDDDDDESVQVVFSSYVSPLFYCRLHIVLFRPPMYDSNLRELVLLFYPGRKRQGKDKDK